MGATISWKSTTKKEYRGRDYKTRAKILREKDKCPAECKLVRLVL